ncbi:MAG: endolytic transglycosylase MltG [Patescibacteria group bacterium]
MKSSRPGVIAKIVAIALIALAAIFIYRQFVYYPAALQKTGANSLKIDFVIDQGESLKSVAARLEQIGVIDAAWVLTDYLKKNNLDTKVEAGNFEFRGGETVPEVAEILLDGQVAQVSLTILEGWNSTEIDAKLVALNLIKAGEFESFVKNPPSDFPVPDFAKDRPVASLEGYLFPATYKIDPANFTVRDLVQKMLVAMQANLNELGYKPGNSGHSLHEILTLASVVELEENSEANRPKVADILWRRLESGMGLYADSTLFYIVGHKKNLTNDDFAIDSPYNTRKYRDLPPTPVAAPSRSALSAALHPELNEYWYYLHDADGAIHFARTLDEHNQNKAEFIQ